ncbi:MAG: pyridoxal phosphate-dependent aminotransferase [Pirellulaceae bacterium]|nr:MAG: pyridoxal phosphate-dependent aminotransferase [Pirellulaceae bacterium]
MLAFSDFARSIKTETAFDVLALARRLRTAGRDIIELEIGDSPFPSTPSAVAAAIDALQRDQGHYGPSSGLPEFRQAAADYVRREYGVDVTPENIVPGPGAKPFEQLFCEAFLNPGDHVLVFSPYFPTYPPNIARRGAQMILSPLEERNAFRPNLDDVRRFVQADPKAKAIFLNSPHNPTGSVIPPDDLAAIAELIRDKEIAVLSDEPYDRMVWQGKHSTLLQFPGMLDQCVAVYSFSKSYSMSGWRLGFAVSSERITSMLAKLINTCLSCVPPFTQLAGAAALVNDSAERDRQMSEFRERVFRLADGLDGIPGIRCPRPAGTFYAYANVTEICRSTGLSSHGLAMYLLEGADDQWGVACLGGECFGEAGLGYIRFSCAEPVERLELAVSRIQQALQRKERIRDYLTTHPAYAWTG